MSVWTHMLVASEAFSEKCSRFRTIWPMTWILSQQRWPVAETYHEWFLVGALTNQFRSLAPPNQTRIDSLFCSTRRTRVEWHTAVLVAKSDGNAIIHSRLCQKIHLNILKKATILSKKEYMCRPGRTSPIAQRCSQINVLSVLCKRIIPPIKSILSVIWPNIPQLH